MYTLFFIASFVNPEPEYLFLISQSFGTHQTHIYLHSPSSSIGLMALWHPEVKSFRYMKLQYNSVFFNCRLENECINSVSYLTPFMFSASHIIVVLWWWDLFQISRIDIKCVLRQRWCDAYIIIIQTSSIS